MSIAGMRIFVISFGFYGYYFSFLWQRLSFFKAAFKPN